MKRYVREYAADLIKTFAKLETVPDGIWPEKVERIRRVLWHCDRGTITDWEAMTELNAIRDE